MKKTIIALIALCGVSMGANLTTAQLVSTIGDKLDALGYEAGDSFTITFTLAENGWNSGTIVADFQTSTYTKTFESPANAWMQFTPTIRVQPDMNTSKALGGHRQGRLIY